MTKHFVRMLASNQTSGGIVESLMSGSQPCQKTVPPQLRAQWQLNQSLALNPHQPDARGQVMTSCASDIIRGMH